MVDLTPFQAGIQRAFRQPDRDLSDDPRGDFLRHLQSAGFVLKQITPGRIVRVPDALDKAHKQSAWYIYHEHAFDHGRLGVAVYGSFHGNPDRETWSSKTISAFTGDERAEYNHAIEMAKAAEERLRIETQNAAAEKAEKIWMAASPDGESAYCLRKKVLIHDGARHDPDSGDLIIPMVHGENLFSIQRIKNEGEFIVSGKSIGNKKFLTGGRTKGCYFKIDGDPGMVCIAEGYATGSSIYQATGATVYVCFNAGNIYEVGSYVKNRHPESRIIICADNDITTPGNPGITKATQAGVGLGFEIKYPENGGDFNDLHCANGLNAVKAVLSTEPKTWKKKSANENIIPRPPGVLGHIIDYYNATSGTEQPGFAVQCALATCSIICSRNYSSQFGGRSSLYIINIGKSGTGKEHAKTVMESILDQCGLEDLIGGDGYTSGAAVLSALQDRPRHVTVIDEFAKYLQAANNKNGNGLLASANTKLTEAFGKLGGKMRPMNYANTGIVKEKRKDMIAPIVNPAITLLCMTTPDDFFNSIGLTQVKDGFLNRFLIFISNAERTVYSYREPIDVPEVITEWAIKITDRNGSKVDDPYTAPEPIILHYSFAALARQKEFNQWCVDYANALDRFSMAELINRANEISGRIALICALSRDPMTAEIIESDVQWATAYVRLCFEALVDRAKMSMASSEFEGWKLECLRALRGSGEHGYSAEEMNVKKPFSKFRSRDLKEIIESLMNGNQIFIGVRKSGDRGRPTNVYLAKGNE